MNSLTPATREDLRQKIRRAIECFVPEASDQEAERIVADLDAECADFALEGFKCGIRCALAPTMAEAVLGSLLKQAQEPNTKLVPGAHRATVSKVISNVRRKLGWLVENPAMARTGHAMAEGLT